MAISMYELDEENKERLKGGFIVSSHDFAANVMYEAIRCKSFPELPRHAYKLLDDVKEVFEKDCESIGTEFKYRRFKDVNELKDWLCENIFPLREIQQLNITKDEWIKGARDCESERPKRLGIKEYDDFIDLDAFIRNLAHDLLRDYLDINYSSFYKKEAE